MGRSVTSARRLVPPARLSTSRRRARRAARCRAGVTRKSSNVDHQQRCVDHRAGVLERFGRQVLPASVIASGEKHEAIELQRAVGADRDESAARARERAVARSMCAISAPWWNGGLMTRDRRDRSARGRPSGNRPGARPTGGTVVQASSERVIDLDGDTHVQGDRVADGPQEEARACAWLEHAVTG